MRLIDDRAPIQGNVPKKTLNLQSRQPLKHIPSTRAIKQGKKA